uniref:Dienelactone hydrolase domain-containing protein n=1 Tax=Solanum lycopersicum TaxID=4081 RepID=A0A3Q7GH68_SOLLC
MHLELKNRIPNLRIESKRDFKKAEEGDSNWVWCGNHGRHGAGQMKGVETGKALEEKLKTAGVPHEVYFYPKTGHAFMNKSPEGVERRQKMGMPDVEDAAVDQAWSRFRSWMSRFLSA